MNITNAEIIIPKLLTNIAIVGCDDTIDSSVTPPFNEMISKINELKCHNATSDNKIVINNAK